MPNIVVSKTYTDTFSDPIGFYQANVADRIRVDYMVDNLMQYRTTSQNQITAALNPNEITRTQGLWIDEGFRVGDTIEFRVYDSSGTLYPGYPISSEIIYLNGYTMGVDTLHPTTLDGQQFGVAPRMTVTNTRYHDGLDVCINHVLNGTNGSASSLIDGENTVFRFSGLDALTISDSVLGIQVGNQSGQFRTEINLTYDSVSLGIIRRYRITVITYQSGLYNPNQFIGAGCLKLYSEFRFQSIIGEPFGTQNIIDSPDADTGWFDEPYNLGVIDAVLVQGISELSYCQPTDGKFTIDTASTKHEMGGAYISLDDAYFKNRPFNQSQLSMLFTTTGEISVAWYDSEYNDIGAGYSIAIGIPTIDGTIYEYPFTFYPDALFTQFISQRQQGDRRFVLWVKAGNMKLRIFDGQLTCSPLPAGEIPNIDTNNWLNHSENITDATGSADITSGFHYTEDDVAFVLKFAVDRFSTYKRFIARVEAYNSDTNEKFTLQESTFDLTTAQVSSDGRQLINASVGQANNLPNNSAKKIATFGLCPELDTESLYGLKCYYPFLNLWQYWETQSNADADFYPNQNRNWWQYSSDPNWNVQLYFGIETASQLFEFIQPATIKNYDTGNATTVLEYYRMDGTQVGALVDGEIMIIRAIHTTATALNPDTIWGMITIERTESNPRWISSTVLGVDSNTLNPLGETTVQVIGFDTILECTVDTNKLDSNATCSVGSRIFGTDVFKQKWLLTDGSKWEQTQGGNIEII